MKILHFIACVVVHLGYMSELYPLVNERHPGPYDMYERFMHEAIQIDELLDTELYTDEDYEDVKDYVNELEAVFGSPMMNMRVTLNGEYAVRKEDEDGNELLFMDGTVGEINGIYKGVYVFPMLHEINGDIFIKTRVLHRLKHEPEIYFDHLGDRHCITRSTYFTVPGTSLETNSVINAHSFRYLSGESNWLAGSAAESIDIIVASDASPAQKTNQIITYLKTNLNDIMRDPELRRNIFSYVNSLGLFDNIDLLSSIFIYQSEDEYHARFIRRNTYHLKRPSGLTVRSAIRVVDETVLDGDNELDVYFVIHQDDPGQIFIPSDSKYTIVADQED